MADRASGHVEHICGNEHGPTTTAFHSGVARVRAGAWKGAKGRRKG
jgi:hypothetical protein